MSHFGIDSSDQSSNKATRRDTNFTPQVEDEWEWMYLDDEEFCRDDEFNAPQVDDEWERMYLDDGDKELYQKIKNCSPDYQGDEEAKIHYGSNKANDQNDFHVEGSNNSTIDSTDLDGYFEEMNGHAFSEEDQSQVQGDNTPDEDFGRGTHETPLLQSENELSGRRIVDIGYLFKQIQTAGRHSENCHFGDMELQHEIKSGLTSSFVFRCTVCSTTTRVETDRKRKTSLGINRDALLGITSVGLGYSHLAEVCANLDVPAMSYKLFRSKEKVQQEDMFKLAKALKALMEEVRLAKASGEVDSKGNALIRVITDGSWGKRSYGRFFSSLSGCAVIIGLRTNKVIYFDVRNKYCHTCKLAEVKGETVKEHKCNKNYSGPSSGMESDIIITGFKECDRQGARFNVLISDGDSNTYKLIRDLRIYKDPDVFVDKLECVNHLYRNFYKKFNNLLNMTKFNVAARKRFITKAMCLDICKGIRMATKHWREANETLSTKVRMLEKDILNAPAHCMGYHESCSSYFCKKTTEPAAHESMTSLKDNGLYYEVKSICQTSFGNNAKSLLAGHTNNPAEQLNIYVAKYLGGKRINYSLAGSYTLYIIQPE